LSKLSFHDSIVRAVTRVSHDEVRVRLDATNNPWGPRGMFDLDFKGVVRCTARGSVVGDWWLYEEMHLAEAGFALHVLLHRSSLVIVASNVVLTERTKSRKRMRRRTTRLGAG
jgi:hypothetical protein